MSTHSSMDPDSVAFRHNPTGVASRHTLRHLEQRQKSRASYATSSSMWQNLQCTLATVGGTGAAAPPPSAPPPSSPGPRRRDISDQAGAAGDASTRPLGQDQEA